MAGTYPSPASIKTPNVTTASVQIAPANPSRQALYVFNPSVNVIWVCPSFSTDLTPLAAVASGIGSIPIQPGTGLLFQGFIGQMNAIAAAGASNVVTVWEYYQ